MPRDAQETEGVEWPGTHAENGTAAAGWHSKAGGRTGNPDFAERASPDAADLVQGGQIWRVEARTSLGIGDDEG